ncbi:high mobility group protein 20A [Aplysia californica]|uniref:High mobility group protein 20A n=1 Tax=Aplysia californica TaxID=6500 RepID=A0ABM0JDB4_APLCA|nr:high mobility group protein 20A [Aplysia californica]
MSQDRCIIMDNDLLTVASAGLSLTNHNEEESSDVVGLHVLTADGVNGAADGIIGTLPSEDCGQPVIAVPALTTDITASAIGKDGEITLNSSFIPENAILMETPRGLMLTVSDNIGSLAYNDENSPHDGNSRQLLSCIPVSLFSACDSTVDVDTASGYNDMDMKGALQDDSVGLTSHLQDDSSGIQERLHSDADVGTQLQTDMSSVIADPQMPLTDETTEVCTTKRKGGWPKGKKRKKEPVVMGPRAPLTGYVLYAMDRRREIKENHPEISFPEVTKILGQEWSSLAPDVKEKYLAAAEADKKRYREELKAFKSSDTYQETIRKKILLQNGGSVPSDQENADILSCVDDEDNSDELHCKVCDVYFSSLHNKREHMYGRTHLQAVTGAVEKEILRQQQEEQAMMDGALVVSEETQDEFHPALQTSNSNDGSFASTSSGPVDIHGFMMEFIQKNYEREQEISVLKKCLNKSLQDNVAMCKEIQTLQEFQVKLEEEIQTLTSTTSSLIVQNDALKMVPTLFGIINL